MVDKMRVSIKEPNATSEHDFPFVIGDEVTIDADGNIGTVEDAIWEGKNAPATHYKITYHLKTADGSIKQLSLAEILSLNRERE